MTTFLVIRHGPAEDGSPDRDRALSAAGRAKTLAAMEGLARRGHRPARILTSPFRRARETAECLLQVAGPLPLEDADWLVPWSPVGLVETQLQALGAQGDAVVALVSHQPLVSDLVAHLTGVAVEGRKASVSVLVLEGGRFRCREHLSPAELRGPS